MSVTTTGPHHRPPACPLLAAAVALTMALSGCDQPEPEPTAGQMLADLEGLGGRLQAGDAVGDGEFEAVLAPWQPARLKSWGEDDLRAASLALFHLRTTLVQRYQIGESYCTDDGEVVADVCGPGYLCAAYAMLSELRCLWSTQVGPRRR